MHACACVSADAARFNCENTEVHMGQVNVNLRCEVRARPMMTALFWVIDDNGTTVHEGQRVGQYWTFTNVCSFLFFFTYVTYAPCPHTGLANMTRQTHHCGSFYGSTAFSLNRLVISTEKEFHFNGGLAHSASSNG